KGSKVSKHVTIGDCLRGGSGEEAAGQSRCPGRTAIWPFKERPFVPHPCLSLFWWAVWWLRPTERASCSRRAFLPGCPPRPFAGIRFRGCGRCSGERWLARHSRLPFRFLGRWFYDAYAELSGFLLQRFQLVRAHFGLIGLLRLAHVGQAMLKG